MGGEGAKEGRGGKEVQIETVNMRDVPVFVEGGVF